MLSVESQGWSRIELAKEFERQAEWRRDKAQQYHDDENFAAAAALEGLARSVAECPDEVIEATRELFETFPMGRFGARC